VKCGACRGWMRFQPTARTPRRRAAWPHDKLCALCLEKLSPAEPLVSAGQIGALHAKCNTLARQTSRAAIDWKKDVKAVAAAEFEISVGSFKELTYEQASWCLDWLEARELAAV